LPHKTSNTSARDKNLHHYQSIADNTIDLVHQLQTTAGESAGKLSFHISQEWRRLPAVRAKNAVANSPQAERDNISVPMKEIPDLHTLRRDIRLLPDSLLPRVIQMPRHRNVRVFPHQKMMVHEPQGQPKLSMCEAISHQFRDLPYAI
jgi:hypothetical protein